MPFSCCSLGWIQTHYLHLSSNLPFIYLILHRLTLHLLIHFICLLVPLLAHSFINSSIHSVNCIIYLKIATGCHVHSAPSVEELVFFIPAFFPSFLKLPTPRKSEGPAYIPTSLLSCATFFFFSIAMPLFPKITQEDSIPKQEWRPREIHSSPLSLGSS